MSVNGVVIVAAGSGKRMKMSTPKQFMLVSGKPILVHSIEKFLAFDQEIEIVVVLSKDYLDTWEKLKVKYFPKVDITIAIGGEERHHSVRSGIESIIRSDYLAIHDAVRPCVSVATIRRTFESAKTHGDGIPVVGLKDSIRQMEGTGSKVVDRTLYRIVQTPQTFNYQAIKMAYGDQVAESSTDDASVYQAHHGAVHLVDGDVENLKITTREDIRFAEILLNRNSPSD